MNSVPSNSNRSQAFDLLAEAVQRWIRDQGWQDLRAIQERAIGAILNDDRDLIISASTASGKTEAAFLPLISQVSTEPSKGGFDLVYVGPLRALINDQFLRMQSLCEKIELPVYPWHGDISQTIKARAKKNPRGILLITPESIEALFVLRGPEIPRLFASTKAIVIDELHALLDNERGIHLRSLLARLEVAVGRQVRRIGLSATLGDMSEVKKYLRPERSDEVTVIENKGGGSELKVQIRYYLREDPAGQESNEINCATTRAISRHLFEKLRGSNNLIFAGSRANVERYADALRTLCEDNRLPLEFFPHHSNLHRDHRNFLEKRLKGGQPTTAVCTSTLELGIDIGDISCVVIIGAPSSVAGLRQRLGRSGRRVGQPAVLRIYTIGQEIGAESEDYRQRLSLDLIRSIAMIELLLTKWYEPPAKQALHLSTLSQQILSVIAEHGGASAQRVYTTLCQHGPFNNIGAQLFQQLLRNLAESKLVEQIPDGTLLLGSVGEKIVEHYTFYAAFNTPEEYRIITDGKPLGTIPLFNNLLKVGDTIIFVGRRWCLTDIDNERRVIEVEVDNSGSPPMFQSGYQPIADKVAEKMLEVLADSSVPNYLDSTAKLMLNHARREYQSLGFDRRTICQFTNSWLIASGVGTVKAKTLELVLEKEGFNCVVYDGFIKVERTDHSPSSLTETLTKIADSPPPEAEELLTGKESFSHQKYHHYLSNELLIDDLATTIIDLEAIPAVARKMLRS